MNISKFNKHKIVTWTTDEIEKDKSKNVYSCKAANQNKNGQNTKSSVDKNTTQFNKNIYCVSRVYPNNIVADFMILMKLTM